MSDRVVFCLSRAALATDHKLCIVEPLTLDPILASTNGNNGGSMNRGKYGGGGGFTTPTKDYEPVGAGAGHSDLNGSSRVNGNGRPDVYDIPSGNYFYHPLFIN